MPISNAPKNSLLAMFDNTCPCLPAPTEEGSESLTADQLRERYGLDPDQEHDERPADLTDYSDDALPGSGA
jgi:hypothetical protein